MGQSQFSATNVFNERTVHWKHTVRIVQSHESIAQNTLANINTGKKSQRMWWQTSCSAPLQNADPSIQRYAEMKRKLVFLVLVWETVRHVSRHKHTAVYNLGGEEKEAKKLTDISAASNDYFLINRLVVWSIKCQKMVKNVHQCFPKPKMTSSNVLFCPQLKDIQFTVIEE